MSDAPRFTPDHQTLVEELRLRNVVAEAFLNNPGELVFQTLATTIGMQIGYAPVLFAWADSWGSYAISVQDDAQAIQVQADIWIKLPGELGWAGDDVLLRNLDTGSRMLGDVLAVPLRERGSVIGFVGIEEKPEHAAKLGKIRTLLLGLAPQLQAFSATRINETRRESMRRMTAEAFAKSEKRLRDFIEESKDTIYIADGEGNVVMVNKAGEELLGVPMSEIVGNSLSKFCPFALDRDYFMERLRQDGFVRDFELTLQRPGDSTTIFVTETATAMRGPDGRITEIHGIVRDITERLESQRELWKANLELGEINERLKQTQLAMVQQEKLASIGQLAAGIAHEINNPLGFLMSNMGTLKSVATSMLAIIGESKAADECGVGAAVKRENLDFFLEDMPTMFGEMDEGFKRISDIVKNLRSFARSGENEGRTSYDLNEGVSRTLVIARNETRYVADVETSLNPVPLVTANAGEINQVILNILVNAAQAIGAMKRENRGKISISTGTDGENLVLRIEDDGPGIPDSVAKRVFEPFFTTKEPGKGTGLGLSISWDIITRKHGGTLEFGPRAGGGTAFRITIPFNPPEPQAPA